MQVYTSRPIELKKDIESIYQLTSNPTRLEPIAENFKQHLERIELQLSEKSISFQVPALGVISLRIVDSIEPNLVKYEATQSPIPLAVILNFSKNTEDVTLGQITLETNVPPFLSSMVKSKVDPLLEKISNLLEHTDFSRL